jgi:hypothetical protein
MSESKQLAFDFPPKGRRRKKGPRKCIACPKRKPWGIVRWIIDGYIPKFCDVDCAHNAGKLCGLVIFGEFFSHQPGNQNGPRILYARNVSAKPKKK